MQESYNSTVKEADTTRQCAWIAELVDMPLTNVAQRVPARYFACTWLHVPEKRREEEKEGKGK